MKRERERETKKKQTLIQEQRKEIEDSFSLSGSTTNGNPLSSSFQNN